MLLLFAIFAGSSVSSMKKVLRLILLLVLPVLFSVQPAHAQMRGRGAGNKRMRSNDVFNVSLSVADSLSGEGIPFCSVYLKPAKDTIITNFTITDADGAAASATSSAASEPSNASPTAAELTTPINGYTAAQALDPMTDPMTQHDIAQNAPQLRPYLARNPNIYPELLSWLASLPDDGIRRAVAERKRQH